MFGERFARRMAKRYRRRGVDPAASQMVDFLAQDDLTGATILEIGGGIGEISVELLRRGAESATIAELSTAYDEEARRLAEKAGVADRVRRRIINVAEAPEAMEQADLVVLHRVVCCYPDYTAAPGCCLRSGSSPARVQPPSAQHRQSRPRRDRELDVRAHAQGVPHVRAPTAGDARRGRRRVA